MEALLLLLDGVIMVVVIYMGLRDERRVRGTQMTSLFRMTETGARPQNEAVEEQRHIPRGQGSRRRGGDRK